MEGTIRGPPCAGLCGRGSFRWEAPWGDPGQLLGCPLGSLAETCHNWRRACRIGASKAAELMEGLEVNPFQAHVPLTWKCSKPSGCCRWHLGAPGWGECCSVLRGHREARLPAGSHAARHPVGGGLSGHPPGQLGSKFCRPKFAMQKSQVTGGGQEAV